MVNNINCSRVLHKNDDLVDKVYLKTMFLHKNDNLVDKVYLGTISSPQNCRFGGETELIYSLSGLLISCFPKWQASDVHGDRMFRSVSANSENPSGLASYRAVTSCPFLEC